MLNFFSKIALLTMGTTLVLPNLMIQSSLAQTPSLDDGIMCIARGKTDKGTKVYFYSSVIDDDSINKKHPVSVSIVEPVGEITEGELVVLDNQSLLVDDFASVTPPEMQPVGLAITYYRGNNSFTGKTQAGTPVSFSLENNYRTFKLNHGGETYTGVCH